MVYAYDAWNEPSSDNPVIAITDTGVDASHPDPASKMEAGTDTYSHNDDTSDACSQDTYVVGIAVNEITGPYGGDILYLPSIIR